MTSYIGLDDGSTCVIRPLDHRTSMVERWDAAGCVWGQVFARSEDHAGQVATVVDAMTAEPASFVRWWNS